MMTPKHEEIIDNIIQTKGKCWSSDTCPHCPFLRECSSLMVDNYTKSHINTKIARVARALKILTDTLIVGIYND